LISSKLQVRHYIRDAIHLFIYLRAETVILLKETVRNARLSALAERTRNYLMNSGSILEDQGKLDAVLSQLQSGYFKTGRSVHA